MVRTLVPKHDAHARIFCVGRVPRSGGPPILLAPTRNDIVRVASFETRSAALASCRMLNSGQVALMADGPEAIDLNCSGAAVVIETSIDDLLEAGWRTFGVDVCRWEGDAPLIVASSVLECVAPRGRTVKTLERMVRL